MPRLDPQAAELNETLKTENSSVLALLSQRGRAIYFPKHGILSQSAAAAGKEINATLGIAKEDDGRPVSLDCLSEQLPMRVEAAFPYAPSQGNPSIREKWKSFQVEKNPSLRDKTYSLPVVTSALTHGLSTAGFLFVDEGDILILPDLYWENYDLTYGVGYGGEFRTFETFNSKGGFNTYGLRRELEKLPAAKKKIVLLNFPNNPSGYTPTEKEVKEIVRILHHEAAKGVHVLVLVDDAYFGLVFEEEAYEESLFSPLMESHKNLLVVKIDGPTKEDFVWGFRIGFLSFGVQGGSEALYTALEAKTAGAVRATISNASQPGQSLLLAAWDSPLYFAQKRQKEELLRHRYLRIREILSSHPEYDQVFSPLPFNSGYFMCIRLLEKEGEEVRQKLLKDYSTGVIAFGNLLRLAFSSTPTEKLGDLFENIYRAAK